MRPLSVLALLLALASASPALKKVKKVKLVDSNELPMTNKVIVSEKRPDFLEKIVERLADANIIRPEDLKVYYGRQSRSDK